MNQSTTALLFGFLLFGCGKDEAADDPPADAPHLDASTTGPCGDVPAEGRCDGAGNVERCLVATDGVAPMVVSRACAASERCQVGKDGAACVSTGACREGATSCGDDGSVRTCASGAWQSVACATDCRSTAVGAGCASDVPSHAVTARIENAVNRVNAAYDGLDPTTTEASRGLLVLSYHAGELLDAQVTSSADADAGTFTIAVADVPDADDFVGAVTAVLESDRVLFGVADHGLPQDVVDSTQLGALISQAPPSAKLWGWSWAPAEIESRSALTITEEDGAAAAHLHGVIAQIFDAAKQVYPAHTPHSLVAWYRRGVSYAKAGARAAFYSIPNDPQNVPFDSQFVIGDDAMRDVWDQDLLVHELGHYWMWTHGVSPDEGGSHQILGKSLPGLAWSEGFANWLPLALKGDPHFDFDVTTPGVMDFATGRGTRVDNGQLGEFGFDPTTPDKPLIQGISESEVTQVLWRLGSGAQGALPLLQAIATPRMTTAPFARGYTRRETIVDGSGTVTGYTDTHESVPILPDFLDALVCSGFDPAAIDAAVEPDTRYPYRAATATCQ